MELATLSIRDYRGIERADIKISDSLTLIGAPNRAGKTSIAHCLQATLNPEDGAVTITGLKKGEMGSIVRRGASKASAKLEVADGGYYEIMWPTCKAVGAKGALKASKYATGKISIVDLDVKKKSEELNRLLKTEPTEKDLTEAMIDIQYSEDAINKTWRLIKDEGWDGATESRKESGKKLKHQWEDVTKTGYQPTNALSWYPPDWNADLDNTSSDALNAEIVTAQDSYNAIIGMAAIADHEKDRLTALANGLEAAQKTLEEKRKLVPPTEKALKDARAALDLIKIPTSIDTIYTAQCSHCDAVNEYVLRGNRLAAPDTEKPSQADTAKAKKARKAQELIVAAAEAENIGTRGLLRDAERAVNEADKARRDLEMDKDKTASREDIDRANELVKATTRRLAAFTAKHKADDLHESIVKNQRLIDLLQPTGLRKTKLLTALAQFNERLKQLCEVAEWGMVQLNFELEPELDNVRYLLLSASEQFAIKAALSMAIAQIDGSQLVVLDAADILDKNYQRALSKAIKFTRVPAVVLMTVDKPNELPESTESRSVYWLASNRAEQLCAVFE